MSDSNDPRNHSVPEAAPPHGLVANGSAGAWTVEVDETTSGEQRWLVQIEGPACDISFEVASLTVIDLILDFFERETLEEVAVGFSGTCAVTLVRDNEYPDRCFFVVGAPASPVVRIPLAGTDLGLLAEVFRQARQDLAVSGLL
jgi:hypothetical protein